MTGGRRVKGWIALAGVFLVSWPSARAGREEDVSHILESMPEGSEMERGWWLYEEAASCPDAQLALRLTDEVTRRFAGAPSAHARLWQVRYFMAGGDTAAAARELEQLGAPPIDAPWGPEANYWASLLGLRDPPADAASDYAHPPWHLLSQLARIGQGEIDGSGARHALALEGAARRWGLLGPWLWRLAQTPHPWLRDAAETILSSPDAALATSPERPEIELAFRGGAAEEPPEVEIEPTRPEAVGGLSAERFAVQVGTFQDAEAAGGLVRELQSHGFPAHVAIAAAGHGEEALHHVRIGEQCSLREADSIGVALSRALMLPYQIIEEEDAGEISPWQQPPSPLEEPRIDEPARTP